MLLKYHDYGAHSVLDVSVLCIFVLSFPLLILRSSSAAATSAFPLASNFLTPAFGVLLIVFSLLLSVATKFETDSSKYHYHFHFCLRLIDRVGALYIFSVFTAGVNFYILMNRSLFLPVPFLFMGI